MICVGLYNPLLARLFARAHPIPEDPSERGLVIRAEDDDERAPDTGNGCLQETRVSAEPADSDEWHE